MIVPLRGKTALLRSPQKGRANHSGKEKDPGYSHTAGVFVRMHTYKHALHGRLWLGASEALDICYFERGPFLNLYRIAHNKSTVDKWDNFPGEIPN
jgi:hypothetical protein